MALEGSTRVELVGARGMCRGGMANISWFQDEIFLDLHNVLWIVASFVSGIGIPGDDSGVVVVVVVVVTVAVVASRCGGSHDE